MFFKIKELQVAEISLFQDSVCYFMHEGHWLLKQGWKDIIANVCSSSTHAALHTASMWAEHCFWLLIQCLLFSCSLSQQRNPCSLLAVHLLVYLPASVCICVFEAVPPSHLDAFRRRQMALTAGLPLAPLLLTSPLPQTTTRRVLQMRGKEALLHTNTRWTLSCLTTGRKMGRGVTLPALSLCSLVIYLILLRGWEFLHPHPPVLPSPLTLKWLPKLIAQRHSFNFSAEFLKFSGYMHMWYPATITSHW